MDDNFYQEALDIVKQRAKSLRRIHGECFFVANLNDIQKAWNARIPLKTIWFTLHKEDKFPGKYDSFRHYAKKHLKISSEFKADEETVKRYYPDYFKK